MGSCRDSCAMLRLMDSAPVVVRQQHRIDHVVAFHDASQALPATRSGLTPRRAEHTPFRQRKLLLSLTTHCDCAVINTYKFGVARRRSGI